MRTSIIRLFVVLVMLAGLAGQVQACPSCKEGFKAGTTEAAAGEAFSISVLFMLGVPMLIVGGFAVVLVRKMKQVEKEGE